MAIRPIHLVLAGSTVLATAGSLVVSTTAGADTVRSSGTNTNIDLSWIEYDPDDLLGLPGNTHVGYLYGSVGQYGGWIGGNVTDLDCAPGQHPWGGHHLVHEIVDEAGETVDAAIGDAIESIIDSGGTTIDADVVATEIVDQLADEVPDTIHDETELGCTYVQDRFLEGNETTQISVDLKTKAARITGTINVTNGHGGHGGDVTVLATPPIDVTITGGSRTTWESSYSSKGADFRYSSNEKGTSLYGGVVEGRIGPMGFADDADDESHGGYGVSKFNSVERVR